MGWSVPLQTRLIPPKVAQVIGRNRRPKADRGLALAFAVAGAMGVIAASGSVASAQSISGSAEGTANESVAGRKSQPSADRETLTVDSKGITLRYPEDVAKLRIGGRLQLDFGAAGIRQPFFGRAFDESFAVRRSWIESYLTLYDAAEVAFQYDFADPTRPINDAVVSFRSLAPFIFTIGNFKEPFSLNQLISDNNTLFTERSLADAFAPARDFGAAVGGHGDRWTVVAGVYGGNANTGIERNGLAGTARATYAPILTKDEVLHLGIAGSYRSLDRDSMGISFASRPEAFLFSRAKQLVDTRTIQGAAAIERIGFEAAYQHGPFRTQAEYIVTNVDRFRGPSVSFQGGYIEAGWVLNGRGRPYRLAPEYGSEYAVFSGVAIEDSQRVSQGGAGVFELGARFSAIDLADRTIRGGIQTDVTIGLNWYPDKNVRIMADYVRAHAQPSAQASARTIDADIFVGRVQLYW